MTSTDLDTVVKRVASENGYGLHKDDPEMVLVTVINQIVEDQQAGVVAALEKYREVHEDMALRWRTDASKVANKILNAALDAGRVEMAKGMSEGTAQVVRIVNEATDAALAKQRTEWVKLVHGMKRFAYWIIVISGTVLLAAILLVITK